MKPLAEYLLYVKRRWRSGGFGIHSPFAFSFITRALYPRRSDAPLLRRIKSHIDADPITAGAPVVEISGLDDVAPLRGVVVVRGLDTAVGRRQWSQILGAMEHGMDFNDTLTGVACIFTHLPRQSYKVLIKK